MSKVPEYASQVPFAPHNFEDRDAIVGRLMEILEAVMPDNKQQYATKQLVKKCLTDYFIGSFNDQFDALATHLASEGNFYHSHRDRYYRAIWEAAQTETTEPNLDKSMATSGGSVSTEVPTGRDDKQ